MFKDFVKAIQKNLQQMSKDSSRLFTVNVDTEELYNLYLDSFPAGTNEIYRERREYDCSCCRHFIRDVGNVVSIKNGELHTIWGINPVSDDKYNVVAAALDAYVKQKAVLGVFLKKEKRIGTPENREMLPTGKINKYEHFFVDLPEICIFKECYGHTLEGDLSQFRDVRNVFKRSLDEISKEAVDTVLELIAQNSLYKGAEWKKQLTEFKNYQKEYGKLTDEQKELWIWEKSIAAGAVIGKIRNHSIGTLLVNISEGMDLDLAVRKYEQIVAPVNYKRPKAIFTKKMLEDAKKTITELGYMDSLQRRFATLDDITVNNILFSNKDAAKRITGAMDLFDEMEQDVAIDPKRFSKVEEISAEDFIKNVLPVAKELEVYLENKHIQNMVSLIAPEVADAKTMFKWNNGMSWAYTGNITDSDIKENVKAAGGSVTGIVRFSIQWNDGNGKDNSDLDAHCLEPQGGDHIYFSHKISRYTGGELDIDITDPIYQCKSNGGVAVENITYPSKERMKPGTYKFYVNQYSFRNSQGFKAEVEVNGEIHSYEYNTPVRGNVDVAEVILDQSGNFKVVDKLPGNCATISKDVWGIKTLQFTPVSVVCYSPNYWDEQKGIGHQHLFFMLKDCINPEEPNGYYNEFLKPELEQHRRVFEALGAKAHVKDVDDQLSGVGFSLTKRNDLIIKVKGATERVLKIKF
ncbi:hypothetical protein DW955_03015 [Ruminococcus sp. AM45-9BH]|jgi:hypothetical protein|nr:hypothetical protein DW955_03015 [Ruminococcus sp. AM45-9BH]RHS76868.1 hypothetical protein DW953_04545 [Ruminococcus sp. AM45-2]UWD57350.1 MAG: hypothetical protein [Bacteriophage sp.]